MSVPREAPQKGSFSVRNSSPHIEKGGSYKNWPRGYKTFFMLNSAEHGFFPVHKC